MSIQVVIDITKDKLASIVACLTINAHPRAVTGFAEDEHACALHFIVKSMLIFQMINVNKALKFPEYSPIKQVLFIAASIRWLHVR